jgi:predicted transcriptional regulator
MARLKAKEYEVAKKYFIEFYKSQKEIAEDLGVTEKTVGRWVAEGNWKKLRDARLNNAYHRAENIRKVIDELSERSLEGLQKIREAEATGDRDLVLELKKENTRIAQEVGMYQKALSQMQTESKIALSTYIEVMEDLFSGLQDYDKELYLKTLDFQKHQLQHIAQTLA